MKLLIEIIEGALNLLFELVKQIYRLISGEKLLHSSQLSNARDFLSPWNKGISPGGRLYLTLKESLNHVLLQGATGVGKSVSTLYVSLFRLIKAIGLKVVLDLGGDFYPSTAGYARAQGNSTLVFNPCNVEGKTLCYNPFPENIKNVESVVQSIVEIELGNSTKDAFWSNQSQIVISTLCRVLFKLPREYQNFGAVYDLVNIYLAKPKLLQKFVAKFADKEDWIEFLGFLNIESENTRSAVLATCKSALKLFSREHVRNITSHSSFSMDDIRSKKTVLYVQANVSEVHEYRLLITLLFNDLLGKALGTNPNDPNLKPTYLLLDEGTAYPLSKLIPTCFFLGRKHKISVTLITQSFKQLFTQYGKEVGEAIISNAKTKLYLAGMDLQTATELSKQMGTTYREDSATGQRKPAPVLLTDEVMSIPENEAILCYSNRKPAKIKLRPYYKNRRLRKYASIPAPEIPVMAEMKKKEVFPIEQFINLKSNSDV